jgi:hypothetical protein
MTTPFSRITNGASKINKSTGKKEAGEGRKKYFFSPLHFLLNGSNNVPRVVGK